MVKKTENFSVSALNFPPACGILCVTGLETRAKAEAAAVTGCDSSEKNIANCLLGRLGLSNQGVSFATFPTRSPLFRALESAGKVTERPQQKEAENDLRPVSGPVLRSAPGLPHLNEYRRAFAADHPRRGEYRPRREETASELPSRGMRVDESRLARACSDARSVIQGGAYL
nr:MAG TPA: hypothetical protein [Caudoviricetes sp.]